MKASWVIIGTTAGAVAGFYIQHRVAEKYHLENSTFVKNEVERRIREELRKTESINSIRER